MSKITNNNDKITDGNGNKVSHLPDVSGILPCPFCGADCEIERRENLQGEYRVKCKGDWGHKLDCWLDTEEDAIAIWNTRSNRFEPTKIEVSWKSFYLKDGSRPLYMHGFEDAINYANERIKAQTVR